MPALPCLLVCSTADAFSLLLGVLVECDASIKSIIMSIDKEAGHEFVIEVLDDEHIVVKETMVRLLKQKLDTRLKNTTERDKDESGSE